MVVSRSPRNFLAPRLFNWALRWGWTLVAPVLCAELSFEQTLQSHVAGFEEESYTAVFPFVATGDDPVEIFDVRTSCGCTVPILRQKEYRPGEVGEISVVFNFGSRVGSQHKTVLVETGAGEVELSLQVEIPRRWDASSRTLFWRAGESAEAKPLEIEFHHGTPVTFEGLENSEELFTVADQSLSADGSRLTLHFRPPTSTPTGIHRVEIRARGTSGEEFRIPVYLRAL